MILVFHVYPYLCLRGGAVSLPAKKLGFVVNSEQKTTYVPTHAPKMVDSFRQKSETAAHDLEQIQVYPPCIPGWWFQPSWQILVNGKDYPRYYGK